MTRCPPVLLRLLASASRTPICWLPLLAILGNWHATSAADPLKRFKSLHSSFAGGGAYSATLRYSSQSSMSPCTSSASPAQMNESPLPEKDFYYLPTAGPLTIPADALLLNDFDPEHDLFSFLSASSQSFHSGTLALANGFITYTPPAQPDPRGDSFTYLLTDSAGNRAVGTVVLVSLPATSAAVAIEKDEGSVTLRFQGLPNTTYLLQHRPILDSKTLWLDALAETQPITTLSNSEGTFQFTIQSPSTGFYRAADLDSINQTLAPVTTGKQLSIGFRGVPHSLLKLQSRDASNPAAPWLDYPTETYPLIVRASSDGTILLSLPATEHIFRAVNPSL